MIKNYSNKVMDYEYNAFMTAMKVSVSKHLFDEHFTVLWANDYFYDLIGYKKEEYEELFHNHVDEYYKDDPDSVEIMAQVIMDAYEQKEPGYEFECPMSVKGGKVAWIRVTGRFTDELFEGVPVIYTIYTDITKLKNMQMELEERSRQLSEALVMAENANRAKSDFLSRMSHDIRTPMNAIIGMTDIAAAHIDDSAKIQDCLKKISLSSQHLLGLINDVLDMSKIESGNIALNMEVMSLPDVLENVVAIMQPVFKERKQHFSVHLQKVEHEEFVCDTLRLRQIFINILSNASKFTPEEGHILFEIEELSSSNQEKANLKFTFSDTGSGIDADFLPYIFEAFSRERDSRVDKTEGSGLGMAITKKLVDLFGGDIRIESQLEKGTTFYIELPMQISNGVICPKSCEGVRVLVVDNDEMACEYLVQSLIELGVDAGWLNNGADAVERITKAGKAGKAFDMVLLDWKMPGMDGVQTARAIRRNAGESIPILIASAYDWGDIESEALQAGVNGFLQKPLFKSTLCRGIQNYVLGNHSSQTKKEEVSYSGKRFLLVEDNALNREIAVELLSGMGAMIDIACDGEEGVEVFQKSAEAYYDVILMDVQMPRMNGYEAVRKIRSLLRKDAVSVPILAMTADAFAEDVAAAKEAGMNGHLAKPLDGAAMSREISKYL